jgi:hypothetical protein
MSQLPSYRQLVTGWIVILTVLELKYWHHYGNPAGVWTTSGAYVLYALLAIVGMPKWLYSNSAKSVFAVAALTTIAFHVFLRPTQLGFDAQVGIEILWKYFLQFGFLILMGATHLAVAVFHVYKREKSVNLDEQPHPRTAQI